MLWLFLRIQKLTSRLQHERAELERERYDIEGKLNNLRERMAKTA